MNNNSITIYIIKIVTVVALVLLIVLGVIFIVTLLKSDVFPLDLVTSQLNWNSSVLYEIIDVSVWLLVYIQGRKN